MRRTALEDVRVGDVDIPAGRQDRAVVLVGQPRREGRSPTGTASTSRRPNAKEQAGYGGGGPHFCLGANLARRELTVMFQEMFRWLPDLRITSEPDRLLSGVHQRHQAHALRVHPAGRRGVILTPARVQICTRMLGEIVGRPCGRAALS